MTQVPRLALQYKQSVYEKRNKYNIFHDFLRPMARVRHVFLVQKSSIIFHLSLTLVSEM